MVEVDQQGIAAAREVALRIINPDGLLSDCDCDECVKQLNRELESAASAIALYAQSEREKALREVHTVLEGLRTRRYDGNDPLLCWCDLTDEHAKQCLATRALWEKLQKEPARP